MATKKIVVSGGRDNLYRIVEDGGYFKVSQVIVNIITNTYNSIGKSRTFDDALAIIKSHSGNSILNITDW